MEKLYTSNPNERNTHGTVPAPGDVMALLRTHWPELTEAGAKVLTAQFMHETGEGRYCFNWNLGNAKATQDEEHMYLINVWECLLPEAAHAEVARSGGLGQLATQDQINKHGWKCPSGKVAVVFQPPHYQCRFRSYDALEDGAQHWMALHAGVAHRFPNYLATLNSGDCTAAAHVLRQANYYNGSETVYASSMTKMKAKLDAIHT